ncbi:MAG: right-handed parallel beta-helix repeat-containing protein [Phycisphaerales bacterium]
MRTSLRFAAVSTLALFTAAALAGPINPPAGPIISSMKTMTEIEPRTAINAANTPGDATNMFIINQPGSYYLTGNVTTGSGQTAIKVNASYVTIDLNGFTISGGGGTSSGIMIVSTAVQDVVRNGTIVFFSQHGLNATGVKGMQVKDLRVSLVGSNGIQVGQGSTISDCTIGQSNTGIVLSLSCTLRNSTVQNASFAGVNAYIGSTITNCTANNCGVGFAALSRCTLQSCTAASNTGNGFEGDDWVVVRGCSATSNGGKGFSLGFRDVEDSCRVVDCTASNNTGIGFYLGYASLVDGCTARSNGGNGFDASSDSVVRNCIASQNDGDGIVIGAGTVENCRASLNGGTGQNHSGIHASFIGNKIINNVVEAGDLGIRVENLSGNYIVGNTVYNTNSSSAAYSFPPGVNNNTYGPILGAGPIAAGTSPLSNWWRF